MFQSATQESNAASAGPPESGTTVYCGQAVPPPAGPAPIGSGPGWPPVIASCFVWVAQSAGQEVNLVLLAEDQVFHEMFEGF